MISGGRTQGNLAYNIWHTSVTGHDSLDRVAVVVPRPVKKVVVPVTTRRSIHLSLTWIERFALPALGLAGPGLMTPRPVKTENTAPHGGDDHGPLIGSLAGEDLATGQASLIIRFIVGTHGDVGPCARWARRPDVV